MTVVVVLLGGLALVSVAIISLLKLDRIEGFCCRLCERTGWTDYDPGSRVLRYFFIGLLVVGIGWLISALINL